MTTSLPTTSDAGAQAGQTAPGAGQDPLAALEELLKRQQAKQQAGGGAGLGGSGGGADATDAPTGPSPEEVAAQEKAQQLAQYEELKQQRQLEDAQHLKEQIAALSQIGEMPEEQARQQQHDAVEEQRVGNAAATDGFEIKQIEHTKI